MSEAAIPVQANRHEKFERLVERAQRQTPVTTAVAHPCDEVSLASAIEAARLKLIVPILVGPAARIRDVATRGGHDISSLELVDAEHSNDAAAKAVGLVRAGRAEALMKGSLHTDELMAAAVSRDGGLRTARRISHCFIMDVPGHPDALIITDAAVNIAPSLEDKVHIVQNAIDLARACGIEQPRVGVLSAVETVNPSIPSTLDAAILAKMADRGQIQGGIVDGPLAMDNAMDLEAARTKGIVSSVAGRADVLVVPNIEAGNMLAKQFTFVTRAEAAGLVVGAKVPVMLTSRADNDRARLASCALALLYDHWMRHGKSAVNAG